MIDIAELTLNVVEDSADDLSDVSLSRIREGVIEGRQECEVVINISGKGSGGLNTSCTYKRNNETLIDDICEGSLVAGVSENRI